MRISMIAFTKPELFLLYFNYIYGFSLMFYDVQDLFLTVYYFLEIKATSLCLGNFHFIKGI